MANKHSLPGELTIYAAGATRSLFEGWVSRLPRGRRAAALEGTPLPVQASAVNDVDAAGVQLLLSLSRSLAARKRSLVLENASAPLAAACRALGAPGLLAAEPGANP